MLQPEVEITDRPPVFPTQLSHKTYSSSSRAVSVSAPPTPFFATTSAEFNLFKSPPKSPHQSQLHTERPIPLIGDIHLDTKTNLTQLHSDAFWELRKSIEENGEGLVRRMRDFENSRTRGGVYSKAKDSLKRGRKRHSISSRPKRMLISGVNSDEEDDVQIVAGNEPPEACDHRIARKKRAISLGMADSNPRTSAIIEPDRNEGCSWSGTTFNSSHSTYTSDDESMDLVDDSPLSMSGLASPPAASTMPSSFTTSANSSPISISTHLFGGVPTPSPPQHRSTSLAASRSEKALAALTLAMANGAGGLNDYEAVRALEAPVIDNSQVGELWH